MTYQCLYKINVTGTATYVFNKPLKYAATLFVHQHTFF